MNARFHGAPQDPVGAWLAKTFPHHHALRAEITADLRRCPALLIDAPDKSYFGHVVELAIGLTLCDQSPYLRLLHCLDHHHAARLLSMAGYRPTTDAGTAYAAWRRTDTALHPAHIFTAASRLAHIRKLLNDLDARRPDADDVVRRLLRRYPSLLNSRPNDTFHTRRAFRTVWSSYTSGFCRALRSYGRATPQLSLLDGHRHADFLLGTTVLEVKSGRLDEDSYLDYLIRQMMTYALLAHHDGHRVTHIAVYAARYQRLLRYRIDELANQLASTPVDLTAAGADLATLMRDWARRRPAV